MAKLHQTRALIKLSYIFFLDVLYIYILLQKERLLGVEFLQEIFFPFVIMEMAKGLGSRENALAYCWNGSGMMREVVWLWKFLNWRWFSLGPAWIGDGCAVGCWPSLAQGFGAAVKFPLTVCW